MSRTNKIYSNEFKLKVVQAYLNGEGSYTMIASQYGVRNETQVKVWVKKFQETQSIEAFNRISSVGYGAKGVKNPLKGKRIHFKSAEDERDYYKAQVEYLKKQYPNL